MEQNKSGFRKSLEIRGRTVTAFEFLKDFPFLPVAIERGKNRGLHYGRPSNSEIKRWLKSRSVIINGVTPLFDDEINFLVLELVFFPNGKRRTTMTQTEERWLESKKRKD